MNLHDIISDLIIDTKGAGGSVFNIAADSSLAAFAPELVLCVTIVLMLLVRVFNVGRRADAFYFALAGTALAFCIGTPWTHLASLVSASEPAAVTRMEIFTGMLVYDTFTVFSRAVLIGFAFLFVIFTKISGIPDREEGPDIFSLVLGATLGMCLMASANHLMMIFMAIEMASVPSYVLAGMLKGRRNASEAALKYSIYGAGAAGVMLYGISLLAGLLNSVHLPTMAIQLADKIDAGIPASEVTVLAAAGLMLAVGLAFKLSAVPFHFWAPDVFEGATAEVGAFLSIASKAGALALLVRVAIGFGAIVPQGYEPGERTAMQKQEAATELALATQSPAEKQAASRANETSTQFVSLQDDEAETTPVESPSDHDTNHQDANHDHENSDGHDHEQDGEAPVPLETTSSADDSQNPADLNAKRMKALTPVRSFIGMLIAFLAIITCTFGNLTAYGQTNIKRLMAYSTIAHAGYMMMAVPALMEMVGRNEVAAEGAVAALCIYIGVYLFMNLGAFAVIAFLRNAMGSEEIDDYAGLLHRCPVIVIMFSLILFSLIGLPPLAGFIGKFAIFASLVEGYQVSSAAGAPATYLMVLLIAGGLNTAISLFYYLRIVKKMTMEPEEADRAPFNIPISSPPGVFICTMGAAMILLFIFWNGLSEAAQAAARHLLG